MICGGVGFSLWQLSAEPCMSSSPYLPLLKTATKSLLSNTYNLMTKDLGYQACKHGINVDTLWLKMLLKFAYLMCFLF